MTTVRDVITGAFGRLGLLPVNTTLDPDRAALGLTIFTDLVNELQAEGVAVSGPIAPNAQYAAPAQNNFIPGGPFNSTTPFPDNPQTFTLASPFPFPSWAVNGFKNMLAVQLADDTGVEADPRLEKRAAKAHAAMLAYFLEAPLSQFDYAITKTPSHRPWRGDSA